MMAEWQSGKVAKGSSRQYQLAVAGLCHFATLPLCHCVFFLTLISPTHGAEFTPEQIEFFENKVRPLLVERCHKCHGAEKQEAGLRLDSRATILKGGETGPAIVPGNPEESELVRAVRYDPDGYQMPPTGKLPDREIETLTRWVEMGAPWPNDSLAITEAGEEFNLEERAKRWSFQPLTRPEIPDASTPDAQSIRGADASWCRNPIDRFILAKLHENGLTPAPPADRNTLLRRASFDVIGLPPAPEQVEAFARDSSPDAYERRINDLLASPHFGERWGRHWLDLVRYAESRGHEFDHDVANAHQYRDYVIRALNDDVPYDQYVVEHVAGDLLTASGECEAASGGRQSPDGGGSRSRIIASRQSSDAGGSATGPIGGLTPPARHALRLHPLSGANESILGTGFWFLGEWVHSPVDIRADEADRFANMIDVYSKTFLGLTVACARCHDHKFDAITTKDFYALQGYLQSSHYRQARFETMEHNRRIADELEQLRIDAAAAILPVYRSLLEESAKSLDQMLRASRHVVLAHPELVVDTPLEMEAVRQAASAVTQEWKLNTNTVAAWVRHLINVAQHDESDPFHPWALYCTDGDFGLDDAGARIRSAREELNSQSDDHLDQELTYLTRSRELAERFSNDAGIRLFPHAPILIDNPQAPYARFDEWPSVDVDSAFEDLTVTPGTQAEPGALAVRPAGLTVHTRTFAIDWPLLVLSVRGGCHTYLAVDSHVLIKGPLHGSLFRSHPAPEEDADAWRTIVLDVSRYEGHRAHLEITAIPGTEFAVNEIRLANVQPPGPLEVSPWDYLYPTDGDQFASADDLAAQLADRFRSMKVCLNGFYLLPFGSGSCSLDEAQWAVEHPDLFGLTEPHAQQRLAEAATPFIERQRHLLSQIRHESHTAPVMVQGTAEVEPVFIRGNWKKPGEQVTPRFLEVFDRGWIPRWLRDNDGDRLPLARRMVDSATTPILPRVIVNRILQHYFGRGIVPTPDDFGYMGQEPSHPELLDWLASELVEHNWSLKHIHRLILTSAAYRMASKVEGRRLKVEGKDLTRNSIDSPPSTIEPDEVDPDNRLLHRQNVKRLEGEAIRDAILTLSGRLDKRLYGKSVPVHLTPFMEGRGRPEESGPVDGAGRRSVYIAVRRNFPDPFFQAFDMPNPHTTIGRRNVSNVPAQALAMMNNPLVVEQAQRWGKRLAAEQPSADVETRIRRAYLASVSRAPTEDELTAARAFIENQSQQSNNDRNDPRLWGELCHVLLNAKEFLFVR